MKKVKLLGLGLGMLLFTACGGSSATNTDTNQTTEVVDSVKNPATLAEMKISIISTWISDCKQNADNGWSIETNSFKEDLSGEHKNEEFSEATCATDSLLDGQGENFTFTYLLADKEENNSSGYPIDLVTPQGIFYTRLKILDNNLSLANPEVFDGQSADTRAFTFSDSIFIRQ